MIGRTGSAAENPWVLVGAKPADGVTAAARSGRRMILLTDPADGSPPAEAQGMTVVPVPFKSDPLTVLHAPLPSAVGAVVSFTELGLLPAAILAEALGLPGVRVGAVLRTRDKLLMRQALCGVLCQPAFGICGQDTPARVHYPVVVKPRDGSGSRGVEYVADPAAFALVAAVRAGFLWEQFVAGSEYSVESVTLAGRHHVLGITQKHTTGPPHFIETGHTAPAQLPASTAQAVQAATFTCLDALGVDIGATHTEVKVCGTEVVLIETHTRAGGDRIPLLTRLVNGHDQLQLALRALADPTCAALPTTAVAWHGDAVAGVRYFPWQDCLVEEVAGLDACRHQPGVVEAELSVGPGASIPVWRYSHERPGYVVATAPNRVELERRLAAAMATVRLVPAAPEGVTHAR